MSDEVLYRISVLAREDDYRYDWVPVGEHLSAWRAGWALIDFLVEHDADLLPGRYRADGPDGASATMTWSEVPFYLRRDDHPRMYRNAA